MSKKRRKKGRPSEYKAEYCQRVRDYMGQGYSLTAFAGSIGMSRETVYAWEHTKPEFSDAVKAARTARVAFLEARLLSGSGSDVSSIFALKNACPDEWRREAMVDMTVNNNTLQLPFEIIEAANKARKERLLEG